VCSVTTGRNVFIGTTECPVQCYSHYRLTKTTASSAIHEPGAKVAGV